MGGVIGYVVLLIVTLTAIGYITHMAIKSVRDKKKKAKK